MSVIYVSDVDFQSADGLRSVVTYDGIGVDAENIPSTGEFGSAYVYPSVSLPADNGIAFRGPVLTQPEVVSGAGTIGDVNLHEDTSFDMTVTNDAIVRWWFKVVKDGIEADNILTAIVNIGGLTAFLITDVPSMIQQGTAFDITVIDPAVVPTTLNTEVKITDDTGAAANVNSVTGSNPYVINATFPGGSAPTGAYEIYVEVAAESDTTVEIPYQGATEIFAGVESITLTTFNAAAEIVYDLDAALVNLTLTGLKAQVNDQTTVEAQTEQLSLTALNANISLNYDVDTQVETITLTPLDATILGPINIPANLEQLQLTVFSANISTGAGWSIQPDDESNWTIQ